MEIWKFEITNQFAHTRFTNPLPKGAEVLTVQTQKAVDHIAGPSIYPPLEKVCMWAMVDPTQETEDRHFVYVGTGRQIHHEIIRYIGTYQFMGENVWHLFEVE